MKRELHGSRKLLAMIAVSLFIALCTMIGEDTSYAMNDDVFLNMIAAGAFGEAVSAHLIFMGYLYGKILSVFYTLIP